MSSARFMNETFDKIMDQFKNINTAIAICNEQIDDIHTSVSAHESSIASCESNITEVQEENGYPKANVTRQETQLKNVIVDSQNEIRERLKREENIIIMGIADQDNNAGRNVLNANLDSVVSNASAQIQDITHFGKIAIG
ncbi:hypothetical protein JTB14_009654 [Gonioctena quinquepunctata]|nr:hypothetical protein JTB14_009654 [Gonioctena quinquepunctata]